MILANRQTRRKYEQEKIRQEKKRQQMLREKAGRKITPLQIALIFIAVVAIGIGVTAYILNRPLVDWVSYGKALANIEAYEDKDEVIATVNGVEIYKSQYYEVKALDECTFKGLMAEYKKFKRQNPDFTEEELLAYYPTHLTDSEIIESLVITEVLYQESALLGKAMTYEEGLDAQKLQVRQLEAFAPDNESVAEMLGQLKDVAKGMDITLDDYVIYLARDYYKTYSAGQMEADWHDEFVDVEVEFAGDVNDYIAMKTAEVRKNYNIVILMG